MMTKERICLLTTCFVVATVFLVYNFLQSSPINEYEKRETTAVTDAPNEIEQVKGTRSDKKTILIWTKVFDQMSVSINDCPGLVDKCEVSMDQGDFARADAVVLHVPDMYKTKLPPPPKENGTTAYVFMDQESAGNSVRYHRLLTIPKNFFHWTMTVLSESEIPFLYGGYWVRPEEASKLGFTPSKLPYDEEPLLRGKKHMVAWFVSNCDTQSKRELAVNALEKYLDEPVNIVGKCGRNSTMRNFCPRFTTPDCTDTFTSAHYFFIAAENSICKDYITEKYWFRVHLPSIPIVMKKAIYEGKVPDHSIIAMDDFESPKALADHLKFLVQNPKQYTKYFEWRSKGWARAPWNYEQYRIGLCKLCELLVEGRSLQKPIEDVAEWFVDKVCTSTKLSAA